LGGAPSSGDTQKHCAPERCGINIELPFTAELGLVDLIIVGSDLERALKEVRAERNLSPFLSDVQFDTSVGLPLVDASECAPTSTGSINVLYESLWNRRAHVYVHSTRFSDVLTRSEE